MNLEVESYEGELRQLRKDAETFKKGYEAAMKIVRASYPDRFPNNYFVCGDAGDKDSNGLPENILVCPAYGVDWTQVYTRTEKSIGPEW